MSLPSQPSPAWVVNFLKWLTPRRLRAQAIVLALCLWGACAVDFAPPGVFDRAGNIKFQDFLPLYISSRLVAQHRASELYDSKIQANEMESIVGPTQVKVPNLYGPQVGLIFTPLANLPFPTAARIWVALSAIAYFACIYAIWRVCPNLAPFSRLIGIAAIAFPPLFHFFVRGQISVLPLLCFTAAFLSFRTRRPWLAGIALGCLILKPQFLVAIPLILLLSRSWVMFITLVLSATTQLALTRLHFGAAVMHGYFEMLVHPARWVNAAELTLAPIQMHSLRSFWTLLIPWPDIALAAYVLTSLAAIGIAVIIWRSGSSSAVRFSALTLAAVLVNPHLFIYDLVVLAPVLLILADCSLSTAQYAPSQIRPLLYFAFMLPLFGPLSRWTHLQLSVIVFALTLWTLRLFRPSPQSIPLNNDC